MYDSNLPPGLSSSDLKHIYGSKKDKEWENFYEAWHKEFFFEYLEKDVMAYQELKDLMVGIRLPDDHQDLSLEEGNTLLRLAQSQDAFWEGFSNWMFDHWDRSRVIP